MYNMLYNIMICTKADKAGGDSNEAFGLHIQRFVYTIYIA